MSEIKSHQSVTSTTIHFVSKVFLLESGEYFPFFRHLRNITALLTIIQAIAWSIWNFSVILKHAQFGSSEVSNVYVAKNSWVSKQWTRLERFLFTNITTKQTYEFWCFNIKSYKFQKQDGVCVANPVFFAEGNVHHNFMNISIYFHLKI